MGIRSHGMIESAIRWYFRAETLTSGDRPTDMAKQDMMSSWIFRLIISSAHKVPFTDEWAVAVVKLLGNKYGAGGGHSSEGVHFPC